MQKHNCYFRTTLADLRRKHFPGDNFTELFIPNSVIPVDDTTAAGELIDCEITLTEGDKFILSGKIAWKRAKDLRLPGRTIHAGICIKLDAASISKVEQLISGSEQILDEMDMSMIGGNYIKIRRDVLDKHITIQETKKVSEKRGQPRITIQLPVEVFAMNRVTKNTARDLSLNGMAIETEDLVPVGEKIVIIFEDKQVKKQFIIKGQVVRHLPSLKDPSKMMGVGVLFVFESDAQKRDLVNFIARTA